METARWKRKEWTSACVEKQHITVPKLASCFRGYVESNEVKGWKATARVGGKVNNTQRLEKEEKVEGIGQQLAIYLG